MAKPNDELPNFSQNANQVTRTATDPVASLSTYLRKMEGNLSAGIAKGLSASRMIDIVCMAASRQPALAQCTPLSIYRSLKQCAQLGLELNHVQRHAYLVPFRNKNGTQEAQLIVGYQGLCELAMKHERVRSIRAQVVYAGDDCDVSIEPPRVTHKWDWRSSESRDDKDILGAYAVAELASGAVVVEAMTIAECEAIRRRSKSSGSGPWVTDFAAMVRKCPIRRLLQRGSVPISSDLGDVLGDDDEVETLKAARAVVKESLPTEPAKPAAAPKREAAPGDLGDVDIPLEGDNPLPPAKPKAATKADEPAVDPVDKLLALAKSSNVGLDQVCRVVSERAKMECRNVADLRQAPKEAVLDAIDRLEAKIEEEEERRARADG